MAQRNAGDVAASIDTLAAAHDLGLQHGDTELADEIGLTLSGAEAMDGRLDDAEQRMREIAARRSDTQGDKARAQLGALYNFTAQYSAGATALDGLSTQLEQAGEIEWAARASSNRGWCLIQLGRSREAIVELERGRDLWLGLGAADSASQPAQHIAVAYSLLGRPREALEALRGALHGHELEVDDYLDAADLYEQAGLIEDALSNARAARDAARNARERGLCELALTRLYIATGRYEAAIDWAKAAELSFDEIGATDLRYAATVLLSSSQIRCAAAPRVDRRSLLAPAGEESSRSAALARLVQGEIQLRDGDLPGASSAVEQIIQDDTHVGLALRLQARTLEARIEAARGRGESAVQKVVEALRRVGEQAAATGSTDLNVAMRGLGASLADFGLGVALDQGDLGAIVAITDRLRALDALPRFDPPPSIAAEVAQYRQLRRHGADDDAISKVELSLRDSIRTSGTQMFATATPIDLDTIREVLGDGHLALFVEQGGNLTRLELSQGNATLTPVGSTRAIEELAAKARMRLVSALAAPEREDRRQSLTATTERLSEALFANSPRNNGPLVFIAPPGVFGVPWPLLPHLAGRPLHLNASPASWFNAAARAERGARNTYVAGPYPAQAALEVAELAAGDPGATALTGSAATTDAALELIDGADRVHLATHGIARTDNPIFSSLDLADGPLTLYDMQTVAPPRQLIVSACAVGRPRTYRGGLAVGLPAVVLAGGSRTVVAAEVDVPDEATRRAMLVLHELMRRGHSPAEALTAATAALLVEDPAAGIAAAAFNAYGA
ncbi:MAG: CHAT domain-containing protein [bacterium]|nr:CHAT domain-containing protein [bacterium]